MVVLFLIQQKPHLALCSYQQCLASSSNVAILPALYSVAAMYQRVGNTQAEMEARTLLIEVWTPTQEYASRVALSQPDGVNAVHTNAGTEGSGGWRGGDGTAPGDSTMEG